MRASRARASFADCTSSTQSLLSSPPLPYCNPLPLPSSLSKDSMVLSSVSSRSSSSDISSSPADGLAVCSPDGILTWENSSGQYAVT
eukprot:1534908-Rhodomonas_salina.1